jgi:hypothetical protein
VFTLPGSGIWRIRIALDEKVLISAIIIHSSHKKKKGSTNLDSVLCVFYSSTLSKFLCYKLGTTPWAASSTKLVHDIQTGVFHLINSPVRYTENPTLPDAPGLKLSPLFAYDRDKPLHCPFVRSKCSAHVKLITKIPFWQIKKYIVWIMVKKLK